MRQSGKILPVEISTAGVKLVRELLPILQALKEDCSLMASEHAYYHLRYGSFSNSDENLAAAHALIAQERLLENLVWALGGQANAEGCKPIVRVGQ